VPEELVAPFGLDLRATPGRHRRAALGRTHGAPRAGRRDPLLYLQLADTTNMQIECC
jgi:hypothetical protein